MSTNALVDVEPSKGKVPIPGLSGGTLGDYLAALGLFRVVSDQADHDALLAWDGWRPTLTTSLSIEELVAFLVDDYSPLPAVAPWNGKTHGGFGAEADDRAAKLIGMLVGANLPRLDDLCETMRRTSLIVQSEAWVTASALKNAKASKIRQVTLLRNGLPERALDFLDAAVAMTSDDASYPPILGTGGNVGRLDLVINYWEHLVFLLGLAKPKRGVSSPTDLVRGFLLSEGVPLVEASFGQYDTKATGGVNEARVGSGSSLVNPWKFVMALEGAALMTAAASRRLGADRSVPTAPFTVRSTPLGYASSADGESRDEFWSPLWDSPVSIIEIRMLLSEGRTMWSGRQARSGVDFLRAIKTLGSTRGIDRFGRFGFPVRNGQMQTAVLLGVYATKSDERVAITSDVDRWADSVRRVCAKSGGLKARSRSFDSILFAAADAPTPANLRRLLVSAFRVEAAISRSAGARGEWGTEPPLLVNSARWLAPLDDGSVEFRLARAICSGFEVRRQDASADRVSTCVGTLGEALRPISLEGWSQRSYLWTAHQARIASTDSRLIVDVLVDFAILRSRQRVDREDAPDLKLAGCRPQVGYGWRASVLDVEAFVSERTNDALLTEWILALAMIDFRHRDDSGSPLAGPTSAAYERRNGPPGPAAPLWQLLGPLFSYKSPWLAADGTESGIIPTVPQGWAAQLRAGSTSTVAREALTRWRVLIDECPLSSGGERFMTVDPRLTRRVLAACMMPTYWRLSTDESAEAQTEDLSNNNQGDNDVE